MLARNVSSEEVFNSGIDLFEGDALIWFRAIRSEVGNWEDLKKCLRRDFQPYDYEYELWNEIRNRVQHDDESIHMYFACMANLFSRLPQLPTDDEKLGVLRKNIAPYYIHGLGLTKIKSVDELLEACRILEINRSMAKKWGSRNKVHLRDVLEPDLAASTSYSAQQNNLGKISSVSTSKCWNCENTGHLFSKCPLPREGVFCYKCGNCGTNKFNCPICSGKDLSGDLKTGKSTA